MSIPAVNTTAITSESLNPEAPSSDVISESVDGSVVKHEESNGISSGDEKMNRNDTNDQNGDDENSENDNDADDDDEDESDDADQSADQNADGIFRENQKLKDVVPCPSLSSLKSQWESGSLNNSSNTNGHINDSENGSSDDVSVDVKEELYKLRHRICLGRSASMRQVYEKGISPLKLSVASNSNVDVDHQQQQNYQHVISKFNGDMSSTDNHNSSCDVSESTDSKIIKSHQNDTAIININAGSIKEKFEKGLVNSKPDSDEKMEAFRREKLDDLSVVAVAETVAREAKAIFKQLDQKAMAASSSNGKSPSPTVGSSPSHHIRSSYPRRPFMNGNGPSTGGKKLMRSHTTPIQNGSSSADLMNGNTEKQPNGSSSSDVTDANVSSPERKIEIVRYSDPVEKEDIIIDTNQLQERYKFFEEYREQPKEPKRFEMTPPRELSLKHHPVTNGTVVNGTNGSGAEDQMVKSNGESSDVVEIESPKSSYGKSKVVSDTAIINIKAASIKEKFEKGCFVKSDDAEDKISAIRREMMDDLLVVSIADTAARGAKQIFKQLDQKAQQQNSCSSVPSSVSNSPNHAGYKPSPRRSLMNNNSSNGGLARSYTTSSVITNKNGGSSTFSTNGNNNSPNIHNNNNNSKPVNGSDSGESLLMSSSSPPAADNNNTNGSSPIITSSQHVVVVTQESNGSQ